MSGKVKITREQAEAIESFKNEVGNKGVVMTNISMFGGISLDQEMSIIENMEFDDLIKALYIGYEVEPKYSKGDWVVYESNIHNNPIVRKIIKINEHVGGATLDKESIIAPLKSLRHATSSEIAAEKERRMERKLDEILLDLSDDERRRMKDKLNCAEGKA